MKSNIYLIILSLGLLLNCTLSASAQEDSTSVKEETKYTTGFFETTKVVLGQSIENPEPGKLIFLIQHHFGRVNSGAYEFFGLDQAAIRLGFEYGINKWLAVGIGRSSYQKTYDGYVKSKILRQSKGGRNMPISVSYFGSIAINTLRWEETEQENYFSSRVAYTNQLLIARKFSPSLTFQITPSLVHKNLVQTTEDKNDIFAMGFGGRVKLAKKLSLSAEYFYVFPNQIVSYDYDDSFSICFDIDTGGHVFQLFFTNSNPIIEPGFITETRGSWLDGDIYFGFNISRAFRLAYPDDAW
jgi:hypothetical protein